MRKIIILGVIILLALILWGATYYLAPVEKEAERNTLQEKAGIFAKGVYLRGRSEGNLSWEISSDKLSIDLGYKHFVFEEKVQGRVYRDKNLSLYIKTEKAEIDKDKNVLKIPGELYFETEDGFRGEAPEGIWYFDSGIFVSTKGRVKFEKIGEFSAKSDIFRFYTREGRAEFEGNVAIEAFY